MGMSNITLLGTGCHNCWVVVVTCYPGQHDSMTERPVLLLLAGNSRCPHVWIQQHGLQDSGCLQ
jgi:hypothetical protein